MGFQRLHRLETAGFLDLKRGLLGSPGGGFELSSQM
jgi:hypothetical protein